LLATKIHKDTYNSVRMHNSGSDIKVVLVELENLCTAVETSFLAFTIRHLEVRNLLLDLLDCLSAGSNLENFRDRSKRTTEEWQKKVLKREMNVAVAVRSYAAMRKLRHDPVGVSDVLMCLSRERMMRRYFARSEATLDAQTIINGLLRESLGVLIRLPTTGEEMLCPVSLIEFKNRCARRMQAVEEAHG